MNEIGTWIQRYMETGNRETGKGEEKRKKGTETEK